MASATKTLTPKQKERLDKYRKSSPKEQEKIIRRRLKKLGLL